MSNENKAVVFHADNISKAFNAGKHLKVAVKNASFDIYDGDFVSIVGSSGCGKSVLAKMMLGLYPPTSGEFSYFGKPIPTPRSIGMKSSPFSRTRSVASTSSSRSVPSSKTLASS